MIPAKDSEKSGLTAGAKGLDWRGAVPDGKRLLEAGMQASAADMQLQRGGAGFSLGGWYLSGDGDDEDGATGFRALVR